MSTHSHAEAPSRSQLLRDHAALDGLFGTVLTAFAAGDREQLATIWTAFETRVLAHMDAEETAMFPVLRLSEPVAAERLLADHRALRASFLELSIGTELHLVRLEMAQAFIVRLREHMALEATTMYRCATSD